MDATLQLKAEQLAGEIATQAKTLDDLNGLLRTLMKSALERMLDTEMDVHLGRKTIAALPAIEAGDQAAPAKRPLRPAEMLGRIFDRLAFQIAEQDWQPVVFRQA